MIAQILVAEDDEAVASLLAEHLESRRHQVILVSDGFQLEQKAAQHRPHLIITDIQMPGAYGSSAYKVLQNDKRTSSIPIIFISAHPYEKLKSILPSDPKTRFIQKPLSFNQLDDLIKELLPLGGYVP